MSKIYDLYLESGPRRKKTMVHVFDLLGCIATGNTAAEAVAAAPDAIRTYLRFLKRHDEKVDPGAAINTRIAEHIVDTTTFIGQGSSYITFDPDLSPVTPKEIELYLARFHSMRETLASWVESRTDMQLDAETGDGGRPASKIVLHIANGSAYLQPILGTFPGLPSIHHAVERGEVTLAGALRRVDTTVAERLHAATPAQRRDIIQRPDHVRTMRKAIRRMLEHDWEHLSELSRRSNGPRL
jgi:predicted RNase H-like HicB family nuclease